MDSQVIAVKVEFLTDTHRIIGYLPTGERRLSDILNLEPEDSVVLDDVRTTPVDDPEAAPIIREFAQINKETIAFGIPHEPPTTPEERQKIRPFEYVEKNRHQVLISLPPFAIIGYLHLAKEVHIRTALRNLTRTFIPIFAASHLSPSTYGLNLVLFTITLILMLGGACKVLSLDQLLSERVLRFLPWSDRCVSEPVEG